MIFIWPVVCVENTSTGAKISEDWNGKSLNLVNGTWESVWL